MADELWVRLRRETVEALAGLLDNEAQGYARVTQARNIARLLREDAGERFYPETPKPATLTLEVVRRLASVRAARERGDDSEATWDLDEFCAAAEMLLRRMECENTPAEPPKPAPERVGAVAKRVRARHPDPLQSASFYGVPGDLLARLLACAEASDELWETGFRVTMQPNENDRFWAWRRTVTGSET